jgi:hypothetical protein
MKSWPTARSKEFVRKGAGGFRSKKRPTDPGGARKVDRKRNGWQSDE